MSQGISPGAAIEKTATTARRCFLHFLEAGYFRLGILQRLIQQQAPLHQQVSGIGLTSASIQNQLFRFAIFRSDLRLSQLLEKLRELFAFLSVQGMPLWVMKE